MRDKMGDVIESYVDIALAAQYVCWRRLPYAGLFLCYSPLNWRWP